ncbi:MAG: hypothetical protein AB1Z29_20545 [Desulfobacterales bacterium]
MSDDGKQMTEDGRRKADVGYRNYVLCHFPTSASSLLSNPASSDDGEATFQILLTSDL